MRSIAHVPAQDRPARPSRDPRWFSTKSITSTAGCIWTGFKNLRINATLLAPSIFCLLIMSEAWAAQGADRGEVDALKRMMQEVISKNRQLAERVRQLEAEMAQLKAERAQYLRSPIGELAEEDPGERSEEGPDRSLDTMEQEPATEPAAVEPIMPYESVPTRAADSTVTIDEYLSFGGAVEVEADWNEDFDNRSESDIRLETADIDFEAQVTEWAAATLAIEWDGEEDKITVDEAFITLGNIEKQPFFLTAGRVFVPFGLSTGDEVGDSLSITDPLTFEVFETREDVVLVGVDLGGWVMGTYAFNGDSDEGIDDRIEHFGATVRYGMRNDVRGFGAGIDIISSAFDSDGLTESFPEALTANPEFGIATHVKFRMNGFSLVTEYNGVLGDVDFTLDGDAVSIKPEAWQIEGGYTTDLYGKETFLAVNYSQTDELAGAFPESRITATVGRWLSDGLRLSFEYLHDDDYDESEGGTGESAEAVTGQLTYEW